jgi:adenylate cyclase
MTLRRLATILAADVVGFSSMMEKDEEGTLRRVKAFQEQVFEPSIRERTGRLVKTTGDGFLCEFASPVEAVRCALHLQNAPMPDNVSGLLLRVGINLSDIMVEPDGDIYGDGVNVAARLEQLAEPGWVLVSDDVHRHVLGKVDAHFHDRGEQQLKNIRKPIRVYSVTPVRQGERASLKRLCRNKVAVVEVDLKNIEGTIANYKLKCHSGKQNLRNIAYSSYFQHCWYRETCRP